MSFAVKWKDSWLRRESGAFGDVLDKMIQAEGVSFNLEPRLKDVLDAQLTSKVKEDMLRDAIKDLTDSMKKQREKYYESLDGNTDDEKFKNFKSEFNRKETNFGGVVDRTRVEALAAISSKFAAAAKDAERADKQTERARDDNIKKVREFKEQLRYREALVLLKKKVQGAQKQDDATGQQSASFWTPADTDFARAVAARSPVISPNLEAFIRSVQSHDLVSEFNERVRKPVQTEIGTHLSTLILYEDLRHLRQLLDEDQLDLRSAQDDIKLINGDRKEEEDKIHESLLTTDVQQVKQSVSQRLQDLRGDVQNTAQKLAMRLEPPMTGDMSSTHVLRDFVSMMSRQQAGGAITDWSEETAEDGRAVKYKRIPNDGKGNCFFYSLYDSASDEQRKSLREAFNVSGDNKDEFATKAREWVREYWAKVTDETISPDIYAYTQWKDCTEGDFDPATCDAVKTIAEQYENGTDDEPTKKKTWFDGLKQIMIKAFADETCYMDIFTIKVLSDYISNAARIRVLVMLPETIVKNYTQGCTESCIPILHLADEKHFEGLVFEPALHRHSAPAAAPNPTPAAAGPGTGTPTGQAPAAGPGPTNNRFGKFLGFLDKLSTRETVKVQGGDGLLGVVRQISNTINNDIQTPENVDVIADLNRQEVINLDDIKQQLGRSQRSSDIDNTSLVNDIESVLTSTDARILNYSCQIDPDADAECTKLNQGGKGRRIHGGGASDDVDKFSKALGKLAAKFAPGEDTIITPFPAPALVTGDDTRKLKLRDRARPAAPPSPPLGTPSAPLAEYAAAPPSFFQGALVAQQQKAMAQKQQQQQGGSAPDVDIKVIAQAQRALDVCIERERRARVDAINVTRGFIARTLENLRTVNLGAGLLLSREEIAKRKTTMIRSYYRHIRTSAKRYYAIVHGAVYRGLRHHIQYALRWHAQGVSDASRPVLENFLRSFTQLGQTAVAFMPQYISLMNEPDFASLLASDLDEDEFDEMKELHDETQDDLTLLTDRLNSLFNNQYSVIDMIIDNQFMMLYAVKLLRIVFIYIALVVTVRVFDQMYMKAVYVQNQEPPSLLKMLGIFVAFDAALNLVFLLLILLLVFFFKNSGSEFILDMSFVKSMVVDYAATLVIVVSLGAIVGAIIQRKKYFKYKVEGPRAIRAYQEVLLGVGAVVSVIPFSLIL